MGQVFILLLLFGGTADGESKCNGTLESSHCSVTLGGSVYIQLMLNVRGHHLRCKKLLNNGSIPVFTIKKEKPWIQEAFRNRTEFFVDNGTLKISNVERNDSGQYIVEVFDLNGRIVKTITLELDVQGAGCASTLGQMVALLLGLMVLASWRSGVDRRSGVVAQLPSKQIVGEGKFSLNISVIFSVMMSNVSYNLQEFK
ncbi:uncharacterized protein [Syngnathus scovelli]|uniref:uncharacterized protein isoform X3 n=1 Tax=Syngnathus scovelli TaxID=161590 RepID=UPI0035CB2CBB